MFKEASFALHSASMGCSSSRLKNAEDSVHVGVNRHANTAETVENEFVPSRMHPHVKMKGAITATEEPEDEAEETANLQIPEKLSPRE